MREKLLKGFCCLICQKVMNIPLTTPCAHNFCKPCLETAFAGKVFSKERVCQNGRTLCSQKNVLKCPACPIDMSEFLQNPQVNRKIMEVIEKLQSDETGASGSATEETSSGKGCDDDASARGEEAEEQHKSLKRKSEPDKIMEVSKKIKVDAGEGNEDC